MWLKEYSACLASTRLGVPNSRTGRNKVQRVNGSYSVGLGPAVPVSRGPLLGRSFHLGPLKQQTGGGGEAVCFNKHLKFGKCWIRIIRILVMRQEESFSSCPILIWCLQSRQPYLFYFFLTNLILLLLTF
jgi:hypothetical protein